MAEVTTTLEIKLANNEEPTLTGVIDVSDPNLELTPQEIKAQVDIITTNAIFWAKGSELPLNTYVSARTVTRTVDELVLV